MKHFKDFQPTAFDAKGVGSTIDNAHWLVAPCSINRDSTLLPASNWDAQLSRIERANRRTKRIQRAVAYKLDRMLASKSYLGQPFAHFAEAMCDAPHDQVSTPRAIERLCSAVGLAPCYGQTIIGFASLLDEALASDDYEQHKFGHWGPGHFSIIIIRPGSACHREAQAIEAALSDYPVLDENDYIKREYEATIDNIVSCLRRSDLEEMATQVYGWFADHDQSAIESRNDSGGYPDSAQIDAALKALGFDDYP